MLSEDVEFEGNRRRDMIAAAPADPTPHSGKKTMHLPRFSRHFAVLAILSLLALPLACSTARDPASPPPRAHALSVASALPALPATQPDEAIARIRDEGLNRSQAMQTLDYLCNVIGAR